MAWHFPPYLLLLLAGTGAALTLAVAAWRRPAPGSTPFALLAVALAVWQGFRVLEGAATATADKVLWAKLEYFGIASVPVPWLLFAWGYSGRLRGPSRRALVALWVVPALTVLAALTNEWHRLIWTRVTRTSAAPDALPIYEHGPWFWFAAAYSYALMLLGTVVLVWTLPRFPTFYRPQIALLLAGASAPWLANALYLTRHFPIPGLDPTPLAFTLTGVAAFWVLFRSRLFDLVPVARELLIERMADGVIVLDTHGRIVDCNPAAPLLLPGSGMLAIGTPARAAFRAVPELAALVEETGEAHAELRVGDDRHLDARVAPLRTERGQPRGRLLLLRDISARKAAEDALRAVNARLEEQLVANEGLHSRLLEETTHDPLTGLFNRRYLWECLAHALDRAARMGYPVSVVLLDLDHFKEVNDRHGHAAGDWMLQAMGELLRTRSRKSDIICRYGGEEFGAVLPGADTETARHRAEQWRQALHALHIHYGEAAVRVTLSAGVATYPADGTDRDALLRAADHALYTAKAAGRDRVIAYASLTTVATAD